MERVCLRLFYPYLHKGWGGWVVDGNVVKAQMNTLVVRSGVGHSHFACPEKTENGRAAVRPNHFCIVTHSLVLWLLSLSASTLLTPFMV